MRIPPENCWVWQFGAFWLLLLALFVGLDLFA
jgi:hypothetical protein